MFLNQISGFNFDSNVFLILIGLKKIKQWKERRMSWILIFAGFPVFNVLYFLLKIEILVLNLWKNIRRKRNLKNLVTLFFYTVLIGYCHILQRKLYSIQNMDFERKYELISQFFHFYSSVSWKKYGEKLASVFSLM